VFSNFRHTRQWYFVYKMMVKDSVMFWNIFMCVCSIIEGIAVNLYHQNYFASYYSTSSHRTAIAVQYLLQGVDAFMRSVTAMQNTLTRSDFSF
jgi:hypothetical protein